MGDKVIKKNVKAHPSNEKHLAAKALKVRQAAEAQAAAKPGAKPSGKGGR
ncbi:MAG: hypothetical protein H6686_03600 [Fibrobacteria bacterium]|nr:hypothetical protein [Fibrobacteria bacterium]